MAKMHEAIYDLLPEEQTQVNGLFGIHGTLPLRTHRDVVTPLWGSSAALLGNSSVTLLRHHGLQRSLNVLCSQIAPDGLSRHFAAVSAAAALSV